MKRFTQLTLTMALTMVAFAATSTFAQETQNSGKTQHGSGFVDVDGDGYNDNAPDHDGDGIPNGLDKDWQKLNREKRRQGRFTDLDGDGINDHLNHTGNWHVPDKQNQLNRENGASLESKQQKQNRQGQKKRAQGK